MGDVKYDEDVWLTVERQPHNDKKRHRQANAASLGPTTTRQQQ
jgi:hypothetical protein